MCANRILLYIKKLHMSKFQWRMTNGCRVTRAWIKHILQRNFFTEKATIDRIPWEPSSCLRIWIRHQEYWELQGEVCLQASKFQIECTSPSGKWIVKITCPKVPFTCLKYTKTMQLMWKSEIRSRLSDKSCRYSTCPTVIFTRLRRSDEWNFETWLIFITLSLVVKI